MRALLLGTLLSTLAITLGGCHRRQPVPVDALPGVEALIPEAPLRLVFSGDVMQHMPQISAARTPDGGYDYMPCFQYIRPLWESGDFTVVNLETTLSGRGPYSGYPQFAAPVALAAALERSGVDVVAFANNHTCDRGARGIRTTVEKLDSLGLLYVGAYADSARFRENYPLILRQGNYRVALLNYTYGTNGLPVPAGMVVNHIDTLEIDAHIRRARRDSATHIVAFFHWGEEYRTRPEKEQQELARWCRERGVDVVIGSHPHVPQPIDVQQRVVYSLGNFVSNQRDRYRDGGLSVRVSLSHGGRPVIEYLPHWVWTPYEQGRMRYYAVPAGLTAAQLGMGAADSARFARSLADTRAVVGPAARELTDIEFTK